MVRLKPYAGLSLFATVAVVYHAFHSRRQFYPAMVFLSTSKISLVILLNMGLVILCSLWKLAKCVFLGRLREAEVERLNEQSWREVMEILFAITIFRQDFSVSFLAMVTALLLIKSLHWLAQKRVEFIETTPAVPTLSHVRIVSFMGFLLFLDSIFLYSSLKHLIETQQASVSIFFSFEYMILATTTVAMFMKYVFYVGDMLMEGQWEKKAVCTFYLELIRDLLHLSMYLCFFTVIFVNYGVPLHLIRELYETFRNFKIRIADYIRYRKITSNMNDRFPDATAEELNASDATCIICREEMAMAKKLRCGHIFHVHCLRSWLERQNTCPTCRALVLPPETGTTTAGGQNGLQSDSHQSASTSTPTQGLPGATLSEGTINGNQARLEAAAAAAAAIYERSVVYPSANSVVWCPGYAVLPHAHGAMPVLSNTNSDVVQGSVGQYQHQQQMPDGPINLSSATLSRAVSPFHVPGTDVLREASSLYSIDSQRNFIEHQIKVLQSQLEYIQKLELEKGASSSRSASTLVDAQTTESTSDATSETNV
ncbi:ERAD-associated E3 ubiquitin-protein ligase HRD1B-like [Amaranthus tricolor]|uniref:ERAD-associated E3 ubiquitin-protein ligase HRD1B-like n=1 Tax=Amaranthus tricolor TaxID=29722 RepID=UPI0025868C5B|nr:ERAD-associated E3 ubiquitin-protein ligase HRD1B-like [Amaranthus tricolor]XP_057540840.1 ERAD-associated E3 ubiquitin-protein ligase HRD1B-like [Amaranthus tricolor]XP_057540846.1 ERAD-associated E3 ubiquitin-protein ligase HRD1B-like [Amaranthus tricolor]XP_057540853.1 ERAD-associated E3 ubiquitin-protein ligase HRD1B-like [Amaranthus tricolor]XP_057540857.1 ERAD-associated E3 ubiquitin-protein ligase HRD1B-like [Amaranthus tricolor]XP_057540863.1 ERAD-associated E3 ubiquitin-protein lig